MDPETFLDTDHLSEFDVGAYLSVDSPINWKQAHNQAFRLLEYAGVIPSKRVTIRCPSCELELQAETDKSSMLGYTFRCPNSHVYSPTFNMILECARLEEEQWPFVFMVLIFEWVMGRDLENAQRLAKVAREIAATWYSCFAEVAEKVAWHETGCIGWDNDIVEVQQIRLLNQKCIKGQRTVRNELWVLVGVSRTSKKVFGKILENRTPASVLEIMQRYIHGLSFVVSNDAAAYGPLSSSFAGHAVVNRNMRCPNDDPVWVPAGRFSPECLDQQFSGPKPQDMEPVQYHLQDVKRACRELKRIVRCRSDAQNISACIGEWMYRSNVLNKIPAGGYRFHGFLLDVVRAYPGIGRQPMSINLDDCVCEECK